MFNFLRSRIDQQYIDGGRVYCPSRSCDVEVDVCAGCRWMLDIDSDARLPFVRCEPPAPLIAGLETSAYSHLR